MLALGVACVALFRAVADHIFYKRRIRDLQHKVIQIQRSLKQRGDLANELAHEIKNPLTAILCSAEALDLLVGSDMEHEHRETLRYISQYGDSLLRMVTDFLDISRAEGGKITCSPESVNVGECASAIVGLLHLRAKMSNIELRAEIHDENLLAYVDPVHLKQVLFNLSYNALKFTESGGEVVVAISAEGENAVIEVRDTGVGIADDKLKRIFDLYARYSEGKREDLGTGLGLAFCKVLVDMASGDIGVESELGRGSKFTVTVPSLSRVPTEALVTTVDPEARPLYGQKILVIDEDHGARESVARLIEAWGGMVDRVAMAAEALDALTECNYDVVVVDDQIAELDDHALSEELHKNRRRKDTRLIVATRQQESNLPRDIHADACIEKPLNSDNLLESLAPAGRTVRH